jgi:hypothetical protein
MLFLFISVDLSCRTRRDDKVQKYHGRGGSEKERKKERKKEAFGFGFTAGGLSLWNEKLACALVVSCCPALDFFILIVLD